MAKYRVLEKSFINNRIVEAGEVIEMDIKYDKDRDSHLQPVKAIEPLSNPQIDAAVKAASVTGLDDPLV